MRIKGFIVIGIKIALDYLKEKSICPFNCAARIRVLSDQGKMADGWPSAGLLPPAFAGEDTGEMEV